MLSRILMPETQGCCMQNPLGAIAVITRTPGISPLKTSLVNVIGSSLAEELHILSARVIEEIITTIIDFGYPLEPYWAIPEEDALHYPYWRNFVKLFQGKGSFNERLYHVYSRTLASHPFSIIIGIDAPQLSIRQLIKVINHLQYSNDTPFILGPTLNNSLYLFAGKKIVSKETILACDLSANKLTEVLSAYGRSLLLEPALEIDYLRDLFLVYRQLKNQNDLLPTQVKLLNWLSHLIKKKANEVAYFSTIADQAR